MKPLPERAGCFLIGEAGPPTRAGASRYWCQCSLCNRKVLVRRSSLVSRQPKSCGCQKRQPSPHRAEILALHAAGVKVREIAQCVNMSPAAVYYTLRRAGK